MTQLMKRTVLIIGGLVLLTGLIFGGWVLTNRREESAVRVEQNMQITPSDGSSTANSPSEISSQQVDQEDVVAKGSFGIGERDYSGSGSVSLVLRDTQPLITLNDDFRVTNGPDLFVYLSPNNNPIDQGLGEFVSLGALQAETGIQTYNAPDDYERYKSVVIWCRSFNGVFSYAELN